MNRNIHFLAGGLASLAVTSAVTLAAPTAYAADGFDRPCGQPAVPAVFVTVITEPVLRLVPAVTHDEWRWQRDVTSFEHEYSTLVSPARTESDWVQAGTVENLWAHKVVDRAALDAVPGTPEQGHDETVVVTPAVTVTRFEYVQQQTGQTRWEGADWNTQDGQDDIGKGWTRTGVTREDIVTPAVTRQVWVVDEEAIAGTPAVSELSHLEYSWSESAPGSGWTGPLDSRVVGGGNTATTVGDAAPEGTGWTKTGTREVPAVFDTVWADTAPDGYVATGRSQPTYPATLETSDLSTDAPAGNGWSQVEGSRVVVVDQAETTELVSSGSVAQVEVTPELPGTQACAAAAPSPESSAAVSASDAEESTSHQIASPAVGHAGNHAGSHVEAAVANGATVLPAAGSPVSPLLVTAGLGALLAGGALVRISRRSRTS